MFLPAARCARHVREPEHAAVGRPRPGELARQPLLAAAERDTD
jgi:hypothetical protein